VVVKYKEMIVLSKLTSSIEEERVKHKMEYNDFTDSGVPDFTAEWFVTIHGLDRLFEDFNKINESYDVFFDKIDECNYKYKLQVTTYFSTFEHYLYRLLRYLADHRGSNYELLVQSIIPLSQRGPSHSKDDVLKRVSREVYHRLDKIISHFNTIDNINIKYDTSGYRVHLRLRNNIAHRVGYTLNNEEVVINSTIVNEVKSELKHIVSIIKSNLSNYILKYKQDLPVGMTSLD